MRMKRALSGGAAVLAGTAVITQAAPALADRPGGAYLLVIEPQDGPATVRSLYCDPDGGTHATASRACDQLESVDGEVARIPARQGPCTLEYAPVRVGAEGVWRGEPRRFTRTFPNLCVAVRDTGGVLFGG